MYAHMGQVRVLLGVARIVIKDDELWRRAACPRVHPPAGTNGGLGRVESRELDCPPRRSQHGHGHSAAWLQEQRPFVRLVIEGLMGHLRIGEVPVVSDA